MEVAAIGEVVDAVGPQHFFVRLVSARIQTGKFEALKERFDREIKPALIATKGCRAVFLVENTKTQERALSVTIWDSEEDAIRYELSGGFDEMTAKVSEFFSGLYQWRLSLSSIGGPQVDLRERPRRQELSGRDRQTVGLLILVHLAGWSTHQFDFGVELTLKMRYNLPV